MRSEADAGTPGRRAAGAAGEECMEPRIVTRQGDGSAVELTRSGAEGSIEEGTRAAAARARAPELGVG